MDREPLTPEHLREIGQRRRDDADVRALLWEIKRLRDAAEKQRQFEFQLAGRSYQIARTIKESGKVGGGLGMIIADLEKLLAQHEAKKYQDSIREDISGKSFRASPMDEDLPDPG